MAGTVREFLDLLALAGVVVTWMMALRAYPSLPERIPIHFGWNGKPDAWGKKGAIFILPVVSLGVYFLNALVVIVAGEAPPRPMFGLVLALLRVENIALLLFLERGMIEVAHERAAGLDVAAVWLLTAIIVATALLLAVVAPRGVSGQLI